MKQLEFAQSLLSKGISIIPVRLKSKSPTINWKPYQFELPVSRLVTQWFETKPSNIAIVTGKISNLVVVDLDSKDAISWATNNLPKTAMKTKTSSGEHWFYSYPNSASRISNTVKLRLGRKLLDVDIRADGGCVIAPTSVHPNGHTYTEISSWDTVQTQNLPEFSPSWFNSTDNSEEISMDKNQTKLNPKILGSLISKGFAVEGKGGDDHTFKLACFLTRDLGLSLDLALPYFIEWNKYNSPSWDIVKLKEKLEGALSYGTGAIKKNSKLNLTSAKDLVAEPQEEFNWLWSNRLIATGTSIFVSKPKVGKTTLARGLAVAVASGNIFLDENVKRSPVVYIAAEENREQFKKSLAHLDPELIKDLYVHTGHTPPNLIDCLEEYTSSIKPGFIILDTMIHAINVSDTNNYAEMTTALAPFQEFATKHQCHIMFIHHAGKAEREHGDGVLGSTAIFGSVDSLLMLDKKKDGIYFKTIQRYGDSLEPHLLTYDKESRTHSLGNSNVEIQKSNYEQNILDYLTKNPESSEPMIVKEVRGHKGVLGSTLRRLVASGEIIKKGEGKKGSAFTYSLPY